MIISTCHKVNAFASPDPTFARRKFPFHGGATHNQIRKELVRGSFAIVSGDLTALLVSAVRN